MRRILLMLTILLAGSLAMLAQEIPIPTGWQDLYENYGTFFATYLGIAGIATFLSEFVIRFLKITKKSWKVLTVCLLAIGVSFLGMGLHIGYLAESAWWETALWGGLSAVAASGLRSSNLLFVKTIVDFVINYIISKEPSQ